VRPGAGRQAFVELIHRPWQANVEPLFGTHEQPNVVLLAAP
jgi:hypothetical protein